ncbi:UNVERIFIED_CONTAM: hypothetical protein GTU68_050702 [Idotea baltica]|nr:hypothetical protein [Idotea baltica]
MFPIPLHLGHFRQREGREIKTISTTR